MKKIGVPFFLFLLFTFQANSQYILNTPDGKKVKLNKNGTWQYVSIDQGKSKASNDSVLLANYCSSNRQFAIWYNPNEWICDSITQKDISGWDATFNSKDYAVTAYCLASRLSLPIDQLEYAIRLQWQNAGKITSFTTYNDTTSNIPVTGFDMTLEANNITYTYKGYAYSTLKGSFQFLVGTQENVFEEDRAKIEALIKGFRKL
jgi:hypothetical protein